MELCSTANKMIPGLYVQRTDLFGLGYSSVQWLFVRFKKKKFQVQLENKWTKNDLPNSFLLKIHIFTHLIYAYIQDTSLFFSRFLFIHSFLESGRERRREGAKHQCMVGSRAPPIRDLACNPGMCLDWELNWWLWFAGPHSIHWATPVRAQDTSFNVNTQW